MIKSGKLRSFGEIVKILDRERPCNIGFNIPIGGKLLASQTIRLNKAEIEFAFFV